MINPRRLAIIKNLVNQALKEIEQASKSETSSTLRTRLFKQAESSLCAAQELLNKGI